MNHKVLCVDDEEKILQSLKRVFRSSDYDMFYFQSGKEGIEFLRENTVSVIVSDMKMPVMNGVEFLEEAMQICPDPIRIILSGYSEADQIMEAINKGNIWRFIPKPWNNDDIRVTIKNAVDLYQKNREKDELTERLKQKTAELDILNKELERRVKERTWRLKERTRLLNMMLEDVDAAAILTEICSSISKILVGADIYVYSSIHNKNFSSKNDEPATLPDDISSIKEEVMKTGKNISKGDLSGIRLRKSEKELGILLIKTKEFNELIDIEEQIAGFTSLLDIVLFQSNLLTSAPVLLENIDKIIGSI